MNKWYRKFTEFKINMIDNLVRKIQTNYSETCLEIRTLEENGISPSLNQLDKKSRQMHNLYFLGRKRNKLSRSLMGVYSNAD